MNRYLHIVPALVIGLVFLPQAGAADLKAGQALHDQHCLKCHDSGVYTREDRRVSSLEGLRKQVKRCELSLGLTWFDEQVDDVVHYLNSTYYKLP
ncbi:MAG: c-type cytochrome [Gammaproteobacteria bacterium]